MIFLSGIVLSLNSCIVLSVKMAFSKKKGSIPSEFGSDPDNVLIFLLSGDFPHDDAAMKVVYMAVKKIEKKWTMPVRDFRLMLQQFLIIFGDRCRL